MALYRDRRHAGEELAEELSAYAGRNDVRVLGLSRGGVPVAVEVGRALEAPVDVFVVRKLGVPWHQELAMGAIGPKGIRVLNDDVVKDLDIKREAIEEVAAREMLELERREHRWRRHGLDLTGQVAILVDDGLATGATMRAAVGAARALGAKKVVVAVPVGATESCRSMRSVADDVVCAKTPEPFRAVGIWYDEFEQLSDDDIPRLLDEAARNEVDAAARRASLAGRERAVRIPAGPGITLDGDLALPRGARGVVVFAHGSGSGRFSPRNRRVASRLREAGLGTLLLDLLTPEEDEVDRVGATLRFDVEMLATRLAMATRWLATDEETRALPVGYFGASTGAAAALIAAAGDRSIIAIVSRGGRVDLAGEALGAILAPTLLVVGGKDAAVLEINREVQKEILAPCELEIVPGAGHLFEEPGALRRVADLAAAWFTRWIGVPAEVPPAMP